MDRYACTVEACRYYTYWMETGLAWKCLVALIKERNRLSLQFLTKAELRAVMEDYFNSCDWSTIRLIRIHFEYSSKDPELGFEVGHTCLRSTTLDLFECMKDPHKRDFRLLNPLNGLLECPNPEHQEAVRAAVERLRASRARQYAEL